MKKVILIILILVSTNVIYCQAPNLFNYQLALRNADGSIRANETVSLQLELLQGSSTGSIIYLETHSVLSNSFGLINVQIGAGTTSNDFSAIDWSNNYYLKTSVNGTEMGTVQLISVPYAKYAETAGNIEYQTLSISNDTIFLTNGGFVRIPASNQSFGDSIVLAGENGGLWSLKVDVEGSINSYLLGQEGFDVFKVQLGASGNSVLGSQMAATTGVVYLSTPASANSDVVDLVYAEDSIAIVAPDATAYAWATLNSTKFKTTNLSPAEFFSISSEAEIISIATGATLEGVKNLSENDIIAFYTPVNGKYGLILITQINPVFNGEISIYTKMAK